MQRRTLQPMVRIGQVIQKAKRDDLNLIKVRTENMKIDRRLLMYFPSKRDYWSLDEKQQCKIGDIVVIGQLKHSIAKNVTTRFHSFLYQVGNTIDPLTGRECRGTEYVDEDKRKLELEMRQSDEFKVKEY